MNDPINNNNNPTASELLINKLDDSIVHADLKQLVYELRDENERLKRQN
jgi:hypothetical protein